jgi:hypothetical protein
MFLGTLFSWSAMVSIVTMVNPIGSPFFIFVMFYISAFLACTGTFSIIGFLSRVMVLKKHQYLSRQVAISFRQALMLSFLIVGILFLQSHSMLTWWNAILMAAILTVLEFFFISATSRHLPKISIAEGQE